MRTSTEKTALKGVKKAKEGEDICATDKMNFELHSVVFFSPGSCGASLDLTDASSERNCTWCLETSTQCLQFSKCFCQLAHVALSQGKGEVFMMVIQWRDCSRSSKEEVLLCYFISLWLCLSCMS